MYAIAFAPVARRVTAGPFAIRTACSAGHAAVALHWRDAALTRALRAQLLFAAWRE